MLRLSLSTSGTHYRKNTCINIHMHIYIHADSDTAMMRHI
jgi:hypothetical protein